MQELKATAKMTVLPRDRDTRPGLELGKAVNVNATDEFDGLVEEICELLVSEKVH